jgi:hypothetical protein
MSRPHDYDIVDIALGNVRIFLEDITHEQLFKIFDFYAKELRGNYKKLKGGSLFVPWTEYNFGWKFTDKMISRFGLSLDPSLYPTESQYDTTTRIIVLMNECFKFPNFGNVTGNNIKLHDQILVVRLCAIQNGELYLEWYEGEVIRMAMNFERAAEKVIVRHVEYIKLPHTLQKWKEGSTELKQLIEKNPSFIHRFGVSALALLKQEIEARQKRINEQLALFNELNAVGKMFGITFPV